ncbi:RDD family protein [Steroidobacter sp.]|uniref:RDD family protein n=1 Tax=Steroidobacter sp. TaxID=1978227 RepID=UPI001A5460A3|nr:RDD family protein [Steroidobacter sp.]MBL8266127.1 RDD family protein [Steroidobacter sp.]
MTTPSQNPNPYAPPQAEVRDAVAEPEAELAGRGTRFGAAFLDGIIGLVLVGAPVLVGTDFNAMATGDIYQAISGVGYTLGGIGFLVLIGITAYLVHQNGQTIGKKILGIKVVRTDYSRASLGRIFWLRNVVNALPGVIPFVGNLYGLVDHLFIFNDRRQCVHDKIADTLVVKA